MLVSAIDAPQVKMRPIRTRLSVVASLLAVAAALLVVVAAGGCNEQYLVSRTAVDAVRQPVGRLRAPDGSEYRHVGSCSVAITFTARPDDDEGRGTYDGRVACGEQVVDLKNVRNVSEDGVGPVLPDGSPAALDAVAGAALRKRAVVAARRADGTMAYLRVDALKDLSPTSDPAWLAHEGPPRVLAFVGLGLLPVGGLIGTGGYFLFHDGDVCQRPSGSHSNVGDGIGCVFEVLIGGLVMVVGGAAVAAGGILAIVGALEHPGEESPGDKHLIYFDLPRPTAQALPFNRVVGWSGHF